MKSLDVQALEKQRIRDRRSTMLNPLSEEAQALIGTSVAGKGRLPRGHKPTKAERDLFYLSWEWKTLRMRTLQRFGRRCMSCGATPKHLTLDGKPVRIVVDHIKPLLTHWHLRLDADNVQCLCDDCNMGKGGKYIADFRA